MARIEPLSPPYDDEVATRLTMMMPSGVPPIGLYRTFVRNLPMTDAMAGWGGYEFSKALSLTMRDREILIDRTTARCGCGYEWGVHIAFYADRVALTPSQVTSLTHGSQDDDCWTAERDRLLIEAADQLHNTSTIDDELFARLSVEFDDAQLLDITMLCGWYHAIAYTANVAGVEPEDGAPRFEDVAR